MSTTAIQIENLSKRYIIGHRRDSRDALRHVLQQAIEHPIAWLRRRRRARASQEEFWALKDVTLDVTEGEVLGIIGRNGSGKSTLLKILSRITEPTTGRIRLEGRVSSLLEVGTGFHQELTGRENIYLNGAILGMSRLEIRRKFDEIVAFSEVEKFLDTPVKRYSSGMYVRLAFAVAAHLEPEILVVDEVLAVGDAEFQKKCLGKMSEMAHCGRTVLFVSHNMTAVANLCNRAVLLDQGRVLETGSVETVIPIYLRRMSGSGVHGGSESHVVFENRRDAEDQSDFFIKRIELLDPDDNPLSNPRTWQPLKLRVHFFATRPVKNGSVVLQLCALDGAKVLSVSTQPDSTFPLPFVRGDQAVDCLIESVPLAAGDFVLGAGLAVPNVEWLWWIEQAGTVSVWPSDVLESGLAPTCDRTLVVTPHRWAVPGGGGPGPAAGRRERSLEPAT